MTFEEKGDLAFKIAGIAVITGVLRRLPLLFWAVHQALNAADAEGTPSLLLFRLAWPATMALTLGVALLTIFYSRPISRWLVRPHEDGTASRAQEVIRIGLALILAFLLLFVARNPFDREYVVARIRDTFYMAEMPDRQQGYVCVLKEGGAVTYELTTSGIVAAKGSSTPDCPVPVLAAGPAANGGNDG